MNQIDVYLFGPLPFSVDAVTPAAHRRRRVVQVHLQRHRQLGVRLADVAEVRAGVALQIRNILDRIPRLHDES